MKKSLVFLGIIALILPLLFLGCEGDDGAPGTPGAAGTSTGTISGTVTNSATATGLAGASVSTNPDEGSATTASDGSYSLTDVPSGVYTLTFAKTDFGTVTMTNVSVVAGGTATKDATLIPTVPVLVTPSVTGTAEPGAVLTASATVLPLDGSTVTGYQWSQTNSVTVTFDNTTISNPQVTLPGLAAYRDELFALLAEPPGGGTLPAGVPLPPVDEEEFTGGLQDRFGVQALVPLVLEEAGLVTLKVVVTTTSGTYSKTIPIHTELPWKINTGLRNVPINVPVLLHGADQETYNWSISPSVALDNNTIQNPTFTPTAAGTYTVTESVSGASFTVYAGTWAGVITGQDTDGRPVSSSCNPGCHALADVPIVNEIFGKWAKTGHAEIFTANMNNPSGHWSTGCASCHGVGYDTGADNGGWDEAIADEMWVAPPHGEVGLFEEILNDFPETARLSNIQCENCHGPNNSPAHNNPDTEFKEERFSLSSDLCGACHGEPARHGRYQQWQLSGHANYELAIDEGNRGDCSRCHTGNGFLAWGESFDWAPLVEVTVTWNDNTVHPQTCVACHDPHDIGTTTGEPTNANVRIEDDTPVLDAGWKAVGVGRGAICMTCHNHRRDLTNDDWSLGIFGVAMETARRPHLGPQADVLMGQSAFFVTVGIPGAHAKVDDTCVKCHMEKTPPPALLSYNLGGTNHTFYASPDICGECHTTISSGAQTRENTEGSLGLIAGLIGPAVEEQLNIILATDNVFISMGRSQPGIIIPAGSTVTVSDYFDAEMTIATADNTYVGVELQDIHVGNDDTGPEFAVTSEEAQTLVKANWNYMLVTEDKSGGAHNPRWVAEVLAATYNALNNTDFTQQSERVKPLPGDDT